MKKHLWAAATCMSFVFGLPSAMAGSLSDNELVALQAAMQGHIDQSVVNGALLAIDAKTGELNHYYPTKAHPKVMTMGDNFVMCAEVVDDDGKGSMANFYVAREGSRYVIFQSTFGADPALDQMMKDGRVAMAN